MANNYTLHSRRLSSVIGFYGALFFLVFSFSGLLWTYISTNQLVGQQLSDTFDQRRSVVQNIFSYQEELLLSSLRNIKSHRSLSDQIAQENPIATREILIEMLEETYEFPLDILFVAGLGNRVFADASSPFFNVDSILPLIAEKQIPLLVAGQLVHFEKNGTDLTVLIKAITLTKEETGKVVGVLFGGIVINDNLSLMEKIRRETFSEAVLLLAGDDFVGSTENMGSTTNKIMMDSANFQEDGFGTVGITYSKEGVIVSSREVTFHGMPTMVKIVFAVPDKILADLRSSFLMKGVVLLLGALILLLLEGHHLK